MNVLIIEDDIDFKDALKSEFSALDYKVTTNLEIDEIIKCEEDFTHAIIDLKLGAQSGLDFIPIVRKKYPRIKMTILTAFGSIATSVKAIKLGADNYILKPCSFSELLESFQSSDLQGQEIGPIPGLYKKEREYIEYVLAQHDGNISKAADSLGIRRQSLQRKLKKYPPKD